MAALIALFLVLVTGFQLFFRYEQLPNNQENGIVYEHDRLTGATREIRPGEKVDFMERLLGSKSGKMSPEAAQRVTALLNKRGGETYQLNMTETSKHDTPEKLADAEPIAASDSNQPPVPQSHQPEQVVSRQYDLDNDGAPEQIIQSVTANDGFLDISVVKNGREVFYARGKQLQILPQKNQGWADLALITQNNRLKNIYGYDSKQDGYVLKGHEKQDAAG